MPTESYNEREKKKKRRQLKWMDQRMHTHRSQKYMSGEKTSQNINIVK